MKISAPSSLFAALAFLLCASLADRVLHAQALPTAIGPAGLLAVGVEGSYYQMDYGQQKVGGATVFVEVDPTWRFGAEAEVRFLRFHTSEDVTETTYFAGPRITLSRRPGKIRPYAKFLIGVGKITLPFDYAQGSFLTYAPGGGLDYVLNDHWTVRAADFEYQDWPKFSYGALHPYGVSAGIIFRINPVIRIPNYASGRN